MLESLIALRPSKWTINKLIIIHEAIWTTIISFQAHTTQKKKGRALIIFETEDQQGRGEKKALHFKIITTREKTQKKERKKAIELLI
jgi:hypothetical protein